MDHQSSQCGPYIPLEKQLVAGVKEHRNRNEGSDYEEDF